MRCIVIPIAALAGLGILAYTCSGTEPTNKAQTQKTLNTNPGKTSLNGYLEKCPPALRGQIEKAYLEGCQAAKIVRV